MDDKWFSFVEGDRLYMHRSWTAHAVFEAELRPRADDCVDVTNLSRNNDKRQFNTDDRAARDLFDRLLTRLADSSLISPAPKRSDAKTRHDRHFSMAIDRHFSMALDTEHFTVTSSGPPITSALITDSWTSSARHEPAWRSEHVNEARSRAHTQPTRDR
jgi:hypothetical protein